MIKKYYLGLLLLVVTFSFSQKQVKSKYIEYSESYTFKVNEKGLTIKNEVNSEKFLFKANKKENELEVIHYDGFTEIGKIHASTYVHGKDKTYHVNFSDIITSDYLMDNIYYSDYKKKSFCFPNIEDNSTLKLKYTETYKEPRLLSPYYFQKSIHVDKSVLKLKFDKNIKIGYNLFGNNIEKIKFSETTDGDYIIYTWTLENIEGFEPEKDMTCSGNYIPHIVFFVENYTYNGIKNEFLGDVDKLYKWYSFLIKDINKTDQTLVKNKTIEIIKGKNNDVEKAKSIFNWVQQNIVYVAYENGYGGFIPRDAAIVFSRKHGDCKDMSNLLNEMFKYANIPSSLTWIGTRDKSYSYKMNPTPTTDNHMIICAKLDGNDVFLDATSKHVEFPLPTSMIQGKEALIAKSENEYILKEVPVIEPDKNMFKIDFKININENNIIGELNASILGTPKTILNELISQNYQLENEIWKSFIIKSNEKIQVNINETNKSIYQIEPATLKGNFQIENWIKEVGGQLIFKPILIFPFKSETVDISKRKYDIEKDFSEYHDINYVIKLPQNTNVSFLPNNFNLSNHLIDINISYQKENNQVLVFQKVKIKNIVINKSDFELWNKSIKELITQYNQSIIIQKS